METGLKPCEGLYLDLKKSPVNIVELAQFQILLDDYFDIEWDWPLAFHSVLSTPCLASRQPQVSPPRAGPPPPILHMSELGFVGLLNNPRQIFAQLQKLEVKLART